MNGRFRREELRMKKGRRRDRCGGLRGRASDPADGIEGEKETE